MFVHATPVIYAALTSEPVPEDCLPVDCEGLLST